MLTGEILQALSDSEINWSISQFYDEGTCFVLGDRLNGYKSVQYIDDIERGVEFLAKEAAAEYPKSEFTKKWNERTTP